MYIYLYVCLNIYICIHICVYIYIYVHIYPYIHIHICVYIYIYIYTNIYIRIRPAITTKRSRGCSKRPTRRRARVIRTLLTCVPSSSLSLPSTLQCTATHIPTLCNTHCNTLQHVADRRTKRVTVLT